MPYRIDIASPLADTLERLVQLGALDIEATPEGIAAIIPDGVTPNDAVLALGVENVIPHPAVSRDNGSVWLLSPRAVQIGNVLITSENTALPGALRITDSTVFGTGHHPTTGLCIEAIKEVLMISVPDSLLDVGTGSGVLALTALMLGVPRAVGVDIAGDALEIAAENARLNHLEDRLELVLGGPEDLNGLWPLVVANILAAPLIELAPTLVRRVAHRGRLILSGIPASLEAEVREAYVRAGMRPVRSETRGGWTVLVFQASW